MKMLVCAVLAIFFAAPVLAAGPQPLDADSPEASLEADVLEVARANGSFTILITAAESAGLATALQAGGPYTIFAPTDAAFAKLPVSTVDMLMRPENRDQLTMLLRMHVIADRKLTTQELAGLQITANTLNGPIAIDAIDETAGMRVNGAKVTMSDLQASNGVIHAIDTVLLPAS